MLVILINGPTGPGAIERVRKAVARGLVDLGTGRWFVLSIVAGPPSPKYVYRPVCYYGYHIKYGREPIGEKSQPTLVQSLQRNIITL